MRFALKVLGKYPDGNAWLGNAGYRTYSDLNEWPVSYHGTSLPGAQGIISTHYLPGSGQTYGRGVYSMPEVAESDGYVKTFVSQKNGKTYKVCLQNRINPKVRQVCSYPEYWLVPVPAGTPAELEKNIVLGAIRPYSLLLKKAKKLPDQSSDSQLHKILPKMLSQSTHSVQSFISCVNVRDLC